MPTGIWLLERLYMLPCSRKVSFLANFLISMVLPICFADPSAWSEGDEDWPMGWPWWGRRGQQCCGDEWLRWGSIQWRWLNGLTEKELFWSTDIKLWTCQRLLTLLVTFPEALPSHEDGATNLLTAIRHLYWTCNSYNSHAQSWWYVKNPRCRKKNME